MKTFMVTIDENGIKIATPVTKISLKIVAVYVKAISEAKALQLAKI